jgi:hypothetical protein
MNDDMHVMNGLPLPKTFFPILISVEGYLCTSLTKSLLGIMNRVNFGAICAMRMKNVGKMPTTMKNV